LTAQDLKQFGIVDEIVPEPLGGAHRDPAGTISRVLNSIELALGELGAMAPERLREARYLKYRRIGQWVS